MGTNAIALTSAAPAVASGPPAPASSDKFTPERKQMEKAKLHLYQAKPNKTGATLGDAKDTLTFQFNPKEVAITKTAKWGREPAKGSKKSGPVEFSGAEPCKLTMEMFVDASDKHDGSVVAAVELLFSCCVPAEESLGAKKPMPPLVVFQWGQITSFPGFITSVNAKYTLFAADGTPIRATCSITMEEMPGGNGDQPAKQNPTSGGLTVREVRTLVSGDTLASVAYREYDDAAMWRQLAAFNGIDDPLRVPAGTQILIPPPEELLAPVGGR